MPPVSGLLMNGRIVDGADTLSVTNPATAEVFAVASRASEEQMLEAIVVAREAYSGWSRSDIAKVGDEIDPQTKFGPIQNQQHFERALELIEDAMASGAKVSGGEVVSPGYWAPFTGAKSSGLGGQGDRRASRLHSDAGCRSGGMIRGPDDFI